MRQVVWEFYINPLNPASHPSLQEKMHDMDHDDDDDEGYEDEAYDAPEYKNPQQQKRRSKTFPMLITSFGIIPLTDELMSNKNFKLWIGHTNFPISIEDANKLSNVPGVEAVKFFSAYRFLICVAKLFSTAQVKINIITALCDDGNNTIQQADNLPLDKTTQEKVDALKLEVEEKDNWCIYILPNAKIVHISSDEYTDEFHEKVMLYTMTYNLIGGALYSS